MYFGAGGGGAIILHSQTCRPLPLQLGVEGSQGSHLTRSTLLHWKTPRHPPLTHIVLLLLQPNSLAVHLAALSCCTSLHTGVEGGAAAAATASSARATIPERSIGSGQGAGRKPLPPSQQPPTHPPTSYPPSRRSRIGVLQPARCSTSTCSTYCSACPSSSTY